MGKTKVVESIFKIISALVAVAMSVIKLFDTINKAKRKRDRINDLARGFPYGNPFFIILLQK